jgi:putative ABC transport system substrate-binding protein
MSGTTTEMGAKLLEIIRELLPGSDRIGVLTNPTDPFTKHFFGQIDAAGRALRLTIIPLEIHREEDFEAAFSRAAATKVSAVIAQPSLPRKPAIDLSLKHRVPAISPSSLFCREGGLLSYSADQGAMFRRSAGFVDRILKGAKPADLPVEQPTKFEFIVNLKTAKALDLNMPATMVARADEVIE